MRCNVMPCHVLYCSVMCLYIHTFCTITISWCVCSLYHKRRKELENVQALLLALFHMRFLEDPNLETVDRTPSRVYPHTLAFL